MSRNRKRDWEEQSFTIPAMAKQVPLHPDSPNMVKIDKDKWEFGKGITRRLSYKECAALQTFPKDMTFVGDLSSKYKQIGNAVPVKLAECLAEELYKFLEKNKSEEGD
jgi:DNA (cytosine-5)-methyltransferase 1